MTEDNNGLGRRALLQAFLAAGLAGCATSTVGKGEVEAASGSGILGHTRHGSGPEPVVVMHEWMGDHTNYDLLLPFLPEDRYSWVFADLRGYGLSKGMSGTYSLQESVDDMIRLMDHYGYGRFHVVGHSMSGMIAQYLAKVGGARIKSVTLVSPVPASGFRANEAVMQKLLAVITDDDAARAAILARGGTRYGRGWLERKLAMTRRASTPEAMRGYLAMFTGTDVADQVRGLSVPITAVCGEYDIPLYREDSIRSLLGPLFPKLEVVVSHEAGHYSMLETPPLLAGQIEKGLARGV
jgi:pimeloyl-ACP methyl ester carboxylesterase